MFLPVNINVCYGCSKVMGLIETVLLSTHNICFGRETMKIVFQYALLSGGLHHKTKIQHNSPHDENNKMSKQQCVTTNVTGGGGGGGA